MSLSINGNGDILTLSSATTAAAVYTPSGAGAVATTVQAKLRESVSAADFTGYDSTGATDSATAITNALTLANEVLIIGTPLIANTITVPAHKKLKFQGGLGNTSGAYPPSYLIKKSTMTTTALVLSSCAVVEGGGIYCQAGNTGDGLQLAGNSAKASNFLVHGAGGVGVRVGTNAGDNCNSWMLDHVTSQYNTGDGIYIHDGKAGAPDANAGTMIQPFTQLNGGHGINFGHCFWNTCISPLSETNTGYGIYLSGTLNLGIPECRYTTIIGGDSEGNTAGNIYDAAYYTTVLAPQTEMLSATIGTSPTYIGARSSKLNGLTVNTYDFTAVQVASASTIYPIIAESQSTEAVGRGVGILFKGPSGSGTNTSRSFAQIAAENYAANKDGIRIAVNISGVMTDKLKYDPVNDTWAPPVTGTTAFGIDSLRWHSVWTGRLHMSSAASAGSAGQVNLGATTAATVGAAGGASALPATPLGYLIAYVGATQVKIPYYTA